MKFYTKKKNTVYPYICITQVGIFDKIKNIYVCGIPDKPSSSIFLIRLDSDANYIILASKPYV